MIRCPNPECQASNPEGRENCASCQTFLPHRYLWAAGPAKLGPESLGERYVWRHQRVVLDTQPGLPPESPEPMPAEVWPYLMLAPHSLHMPQPYALLNAGTDQEILLLDAAAIAPASGERKPRLLPTLAEAWQSASALQQLSWLWQVAGLWPDFTEQQVASSLLGERLRVQGSLVTLLELTPDPQPLTLEALGAFGRTLVAQAQPSIREFLDSLCTQLTQGDIATPEVLVACLDRAIVAAAASHPVDYGLAVQTDQGPSRKRNEDACYPASGTSQTHIAGPGSQANPPLLLLVCDGIGGHDGGDVASRLAIATIQQQLAPLLEQLSTQATHDPVAVNLAIEQAVWAANDKISQHNDQGHRHARDRMGTTLVMALAIGVQIYIAHIGDSRAYHIGPTSCRQITFDDDVAAREVRLGYGFYADVANRPGTGALIQALGMGSSASLHMSVQRLILSEDTVLLLCSDGLSDYERVEQFWQTQLLPVLKRQAQPATAVTNLIQLANQYNGHDNITVGLISGRIQPPKSSPPPVAKPAPSALLTPSLSNTRLGLQPGLQSPEVSAAEAPSVAAPAKNSPWPILLGLVGGLGLATAITMIVFREGPIAFPPSFTPSSSEAVPGAVPENSEVGIADSGLASPSLAPRSYLQLAQPVALLGAPQLPAAASEDNALGQLSTGAIVQVITRQDLAADQSRWVKLKVCAVNELQSSGQALTGAIESSPNGTEVNPSESAVTLSAPTPLTSGTEGWILEARLAPIARAAEALACPSN
ncbi:MAG: protein phosphatase 2C domain-containing protein [Cyanobacteria bacterium P01_A01_bin.15]